MNEMNGSRNHDGLPHLVKLAPNPDLPAGMISCACCDKPQVHPMIVAWDCDLEGYVCAGCVPVLAAVEWLLAHEVKGLRRPDVEELPGLSEGERI